MLSITEKARESRLRYALDKVGCGIIKSRHPLSPDNLGEYMLVDYYANCVLADSGRYDMTLDDVEAWLN